MSVPKILTIVGWILVVAGVLALVYNFFGMYSLAGKCPDGTDGCDVYLQWQAINRLGILAAIAGGLSLLTAFVVGKRQ